MQKQSYSSIAVKLLIFIVIGILIKVFVPVSYALTPTGVTYLAIFVPTILCWLFIDTGWCSILAIAAFLLFNVMTSTEVLGGSFGNVIVMQVVFTSVFTGKLMEHGVLQHLAWWLLSRKIVHRHPYRFLLSWGITVLVLVMAAGHIIALTLIVALLRVLRETLKLEKKDKFYITLCMMSLWVAVVSENVLPFAMPAPLTGVSLLNSFGFTEYTIGTFVVHSSIPVAVLSIGLSLLVIRLIVRPDTSNFMHYNDDEIRERLRTEKIPVEGKLTVAGLIFVIVGAFMPTLSFLGAFSAWCGRVTMYGFITLAISILCFIHIKGKPVMDVGADLQKYLAWKPILFISTIMLISSTLSSESYGIVGTLIAIMAPVASKLPVIVVIIAGAVLVVVLTNLMSNVVSCVIGMAVFCPVLAATGVAPSMVMAVGTLYIILAATAVLTPSAAAGVPIIMGVEAEMKDMFKYSLIWVVLFVVCMFAVQLGLLSRI